MTYTAHLNKKIVLPSGNWFSGFKADVESRTVTYTYHDRRRNGQVARHYTVTFKADLSTIESVTAVSANGGRVEHFKTVAIREDLASLLMSAKKIKVEQKKANLSAFLYGLFITLIVIEVVTGVALFILPEGTGFEIIANVFLTSVLVAPIVGFFAVQSN